MTMKKRITSFALVLLMVLSSLAVLLPIMGVKTAADGEKTYKKVTAEPADWTGTYLIVYEAGSYAFNGVDKGKTQVKIADGKIVATDAVEFEIASMESGYSIRIVGGANNGSYLGHTSSRNDVAIGSAAMPNTLSMSGENVNITSGNYTLKFNKSAGYFRYYKSGQQSIQLYKLDESACNHKSSSSYKQTEDGSQHYQICDDCGAEFNKGAHIATWTPAEDGVHHTGVCEICKETVTKAHVADEAYATNETEHWHICNECDAEVNKEAHSFNDDGVCTVCSYDKNGSKEKDVTITFTNDAAINNKITYEDKLRGLTVTFDKSNGSTPPKWYADGESVRAYAKNTITFEVTSGTIRKIVITFGNGDKTNTITSDLGEYKDGTWTGSATKVVFTIGGTSGHRRFASAVVTLAESGACEHAYTYTPNNDGTHNGVCSLCSNTIENEACVYTTTVGADGTNTFTCDKCGHVKTYTPAELVAAIEALGSGEYFVGDCILTGYISEVNHPYSNTNKTPTFTIMVAGKEVYCFKATGAFVADFVLGDVVTLTGAMMNFKGNTVEFYQAEITDCKKTISSATLNIGTNIDVNYYVTIPDVVSYESYVMRFTFNGKTFDVTGVEDPKGLKFTFKDIGPHQMGLNISAVLYGKTAEGAETKLSEKTTYSVKENLESLLNNETSSEKVKTLAKNMLIYGAAAQKYNGADDSKLVTDKTHDTAPSLADTNAATVENIGEKVKFVGMVLYFDSEPRLAIKYELLKGATETDVTFTDGAGNTFEHKDGYVYLTGVTADQFAVENKVVSSDGSTVTLSVNTYIYYILKGSTNENMKALATALYYYGAAAEAYVDAQ